MLHIRIRIILPDPDLQHPSGKWLGSGSYLLLGTICFYLISFLTLLTNTASVRKYDTSTIDVLVKNYLAFIKLISGIWICYKMAVSTTSVADNHYEELVTSRRNRWVLGGAGRRHLKNLMLYHRKKMLLHFVLQVESVCIVRNRKHTENAGRKSYSYAIYFREQVTYCLEEH